ncbi:MAG: type IX secretion system outer membrane channel protein PorV [Bacteroidales bacterium]|nr:type IX secretion system outer membrane channel protein PorV [Bacteroidales bacterium]
MNKHTKILAIIAAIAITYNIYAQKDKIGGQNYISTAMPIIMVSPDATSAGMGDVGVASKPDANSLHWNNAKLAFVEDGAGFTMTYTPWLRKLGVGDMNILYLGGYYSINDRSTVGGSIMYYSVGEVEFRDEDGLDKGTYKPNEFSIDLSYSMKLSETFSLGASGRYLRSDLTQGQDVGTAPTKAGNAIAADIGVYYQDKLSASTSMPGELALGLFISNLGSKISYSDVNTDKDFLPANLRLGGRYTLNIDEFNQFSLLLDLNKLLVPTPPVYDKDSNGTNVIIAGMNDRAEDISVMQGVFQSFYDAPNGLTEELQEIQLSVGAEYWYSQIFAVRAGYFFEHKNKGGRQYITFGGGIRYNMFTFDVSYLIALSRTQNPLANTVRISLGMNFGKTSATKKSSN